MSRSTQHILSISIFASLLFFTNLGEPRLWDRDEPRNARCAAEMLAANDWVLPTFNAELRDHKPIMTYWGMMLSYSLFGVNEFAARFFSALYGVGTVLLTYFIGSRLFRPSVGFWSAIALSSTIMFSVASRAATPDAPLIFYSTLALSIYVWGTTSAQDRTVASKSFMQDYPQRWWVIALMFAAMGLAVLAKGPVGLVLPTAVIGMFLLIVRLPERTFNPGEQSWGQTVISMLRPFAPLHFLKTCWSMRPITAIVIAGVISVPWFVMVHLRSNGEFTRGFFLTHNVSRAMNSMEGHTGGPWFYPVALLIGFFPWSVFWLPSLLDGIKQLRSKVPWWQGYVFACCWVGVYVILFTVAGTKLPSYITPCYPAVALLMGVFIDRVASQEIILSSLWRRLALGSLITVGLCVTVGLPIAGHIFLHGEYLLGLLGLVLIVGGTLALLSFESQQTQQACLQLACTAGIFLMGLMSIVTLRIDRHRPIKELLMAVYQNENIDRVDVASFGSIEPSCVFYCEQTIEIFNTPTDASRFLNEPGPSERVIITSQSKLPLLYESIPEQQLVVTQLPDFVDQPGVVVLRKRQTATAGAKPSTTMH